MEYSKRMAKLQKLEGQVDIKCSAEKTFEMRTTQSDIPKLCSDKVTSVVAHQGDWLNVGSIRKCDFIIDGKHEYLIDRIESIDEKKMTLRRTVIDGDIMKHYKTLIFQVQVISKGKNESCLVKCCFEVNPEPIKLLNFTLDALKDLVGAWWWLFYM